VQDEVGEGTWARWFENDHLMSPAFFVWDELRRAVLRAELAYILDTFSIVRRRDEEG
jgi:hypothetical protein